MIDNKELEELVRHSLRNYEEILQRLVLRMEKVEWAIKTMQEKEKKE